MKKQAVPEAHTAFLAKAQEQGHSVIHLRFYDGPQLCTQIWADETARQVAIQNEISDPLRTAFGVNKAPAWADYEAFLLERCVPKERDGLNYYLKELGLADFDPLAILRKTKGRMAEDGHWLEILEE